MRRLILVVLVAALALVTQAVNAEIIQFGFASNTNAAIEFTGGAAGQGQIAFPDHESYDFTMTASSTNFGGLQGNIGGTFTVGAIAAQTIVIPPSVTFPYPISYLVERATVTSNGGQFSVRDNADLDGITLTANLNWSDIYVTNQYFGALNATGIANLTQVSYLGENLELQKFAAAGDQMVNLTFQFPTMKSLTNLMAPGEVNSTSYSGSGVATVPEPSTCVLLVTAGVGLAACVLRRRRAA